MNLHDYPANAETARAEQSVIGALLIDNDALDRIPDLSVEHFYQPDHRLIFTEIRKQVAGGKRCDVISLYDALSKKVDDCLTYLHQCQQSISSAANIGRYAEIVTDKALKRALAAIGEELKGVAASQENSASLIDSAASKIEALAQTKTKQEPVRLSDMLGNYVDLIQQRIDGKIKPIATGFRDLDARLDGGVERGTLTIVAGRPGTGKTAFALCLSRQVAEEGSALFLSMEMSRDQVNDRNIAALGALPLSWLKRPTEDHSDNWTRMTNAFRKAQDLNLWIDDQTALNMLDIRSKARAVKRKNGLDILVIDQLSFITGGESESQWQVVGEYTRALLALAKELNIAVVLLCQLNRKCEERNNKRPMLADLAMSGSIEQDAANILFLYRDEIYNPDSKDKGVCEVALAKQRQGEPGIVGLTYIGNQTRFEDMAYPWQQRAVESAPARRGFE